MKSLLTKSRMGAARACRRLHFLAYELGFRPVHEEEVLFFGTIMHKALEPWWKGWQLDDDTRLGVALAALARVDDLYLRAKAEVMMTAYHFRWKDEPYDVISVEQTFRAPLRNPATGATSHTWDLGGALDVLLLDRRTNEKCFMEHKTSGEDIQPGSDYWKRLRMDTQVSVYFEGARALGHDVTKCVYDILGKPAQKPSLVPVLDDDGVKIVLDAEGNRVRTKDGKKWRESASSADGYMLQTRPETPEEYRARLTEVISADPNRFLVRGEVVRLEQEMIDAQTDTWQLGQELREARLQKRHPRNPDACVRVGLGTCPFFAVCSGEASLDDPTRYHRIADVHPELSRPEVQPEEGAAS